MLGDKSADLISKHFAESFKREVDAEEAIWRSLPFFVALLGLAIAVLPTIYRQAIALPISWWSAPAAVFLVLTVMAFGVSAYWFSRIISLRRYRYPPNDSKVLEYARALDQYYEAFGSSSADRDASTAYDLRHSILIELAAASTQNRTHNVARSTARSQALLFMMIGFSLAFITEVSILGQEALTRVGAPAKAGI